MKDYTAIIGLQDNVKAEIKFAYNEGYEQGIKDGNINDGTFAQKVKEAYQNGMDDAWEACRKMEYMLFNEPQFKECFGDIDFYTVVTKKSASETLQKIREYEEKQTEKNCDNCAHDPETNDFSKYCKSCTNSNNWQPKQDAEIMVGEEVTYGGMADKDGKMIYTGIITKCDNDNVWVMEKDGKSYEFEKRLILSKTGRHFPEIEQVLKAMQG